MGRTLWRMLRADWNALGVGGWLTVIASLLFGWLVVAAFWLTVRQLLGRFPRLTALTSGYLGLCGISGTLLLSANLVDALCQRHPVAFAPLGWELVRSFGTGAFGMPLWLPVSLLVLFGCRDYCSC